MFDKYFSVNKNNKPVEPEPEFFESPDGKEAIKVIPYRSPRWQRSTKYLVASAILVLLLVALIFLRSLISPILVAVIMTYLFQPISCFFNTKLNISWKASVIILYVLLILLIVGLAAWGGISLASQAENLINFITQIFNDLTRQKSPTVNSPEATTAIQHFLSSFFSSETGTEFFSTVQNILSGITGSIGNLISGFAATVISFFFSFGLSFFLLFESDGAPGKTISFNLEGYEYDFQKGRQQLTRIWNSFLRGQILLMVFTILLYFLVFLILGLNYSLALAFLMGLARLVPYIGSTVAYIFFAIVAFYQPTTFIGMPHLNYTIMIVLIAFIIDKLMDSVLTPKVMADTLKIHPAAVLVAAIVFAKLLGLIGIFLAAPIVASIKLLITYIYRKMTDQDPWKGFETIAKPIPLRQIMRNSWETSKKFMGELVVFTINFSKWLAQKIKILSANLSNNIKDFRSKRKDRNNHEQSGNQTANHRPD